MRMEKHLAALREVMDEIESALEDPGGLTKHQRRLATMLSLGVCELVEIYFHKLGIMKSGSRIKHIMLRRKNINENLSKQIITPIESVKNIDAIIELARGVEEERNNMAYGSPQPHEKLLQAKIQDFLNLKSLIEKEIGEII
ncbi:MAG: hypothetical protein U9O96_06855 [Candidatus Thermoplasmatota archaeon]|nr:hypothetical protein [Candidatus Thermoplasmatota archaeon]